MKKLISFFLLLSSALFSESLDFSELVKEQRNSVVNIESTRRIETQMSRSYGGFPEELFREFGFPMPDQREQRPQQREAVSTGSGFVISSDGYVITNFHVVQDADEVVVKFYDRKEFKAEIIGTDELSDIALLKITDDEFIPVELGNSDIVEQGDGVIAIGSPYNYDFSVTFGIISAKGRGITSGRGIGDYVPYLQTDAAVNRGNSGGPLFNLDGEVIGINSQIYSRSGGNEGLAFAIPINVALEVIEQLKESGKVSRGYLGVQGGEVSSDLAIALGMDKPYGALVRSVVEGEAAESSGILPGDVIVEIGGKEIIYFKDLQHNIGRTRPETEVVAKIFREGKYINLDIIVGELPVVQEVNETKEEPKDPDYPLGMNLREVDPNNRAPNDPEYGLRVLRVFSNSPAFGQIFEGDVITKITFKNKSFEITTLDSFVKTLESFDTGDIILIIGTRNGANLFEPVEIE
jgi:serine protease Do